jgi:hypothetical protein
MKVTWPDAFGLVKEPGRGLPPNVQSILNYDRGTCARGSRRVHGWHGSPLAYKFPKMGRPVRKIIEHDSCRARRPQQFTKVNFSQLRSHACWGCLENSG